MRSEIPENIEIRLKQTQIDAHGIIKIDVTKLARLNDFLDLPYSAGVDEGVVDHQNLLL